MKPVFNCTINKGKLVAPVEYFDHLRSFKNGEQVRVTVDKHKKQRSNPQNRYFHSVIVKMISDETGYEVSEVKEMIRMLFLSHELKVGDEIVKVGKSTAALNTLEFEELNSQCRRWASQTIGLYLPEPNEIEY